MEIDPVPTVQEAGLAIGRIWTGTENLTFTPGFNPQTLWLILSCYTHVEVTYSSTLTLALNGRQWSTSCPRRFNLKKEHLVEGGRAPEPVLTFWRRETSFVSSRIQAPKNQPVL